VIGDLSGTVRVYDALNLEKCQFLTFKP